MIFCLSGPMRGLPDHNFPAFFAVEGATYDWFYSMKAPGNGTIWELRNPANNFDGDVTKPTEEYMQIDLQNVLDCDALVLLPGWESSAGAAVEVQVAIATGKRFLQAELSEGCPPDLPDSYHVRELESLPEPLGQSPRAQALDETKALVTGDRNNQYGPPTADFRRTADALTAYGYRHTQLPASSPACPQCGARPLRPHDTAIAVDCVKTSRIMWSPFKLDHWLDKMGYSACGYECATEEKNDL